MGADKREAGRKKAENNNDGEEQKNQSESIDEKETKELYFEYKLASEQLKKIESYAKDTEKSLEQISETMLSLEQFSNQKKGARLFAPIANGIFIDVTLNDPKTFRMNIGKGVVVSKSLEEAEALLERQKKDLTILKSRAENDIFKLNARLREIESLIGE